MAVGGLFCQCSQSAEVECDAAIDGAGGVDTVDADPLDGRDDEAAAIVEITPAIISNIVVIQLDIDIFAIARGLCIMRGHVGVAAGIDGEADEGHDAQPWQHGNLVAKVDGGGRRIGDETEVLGVVHAGHAVVVLVHGAGAGEVEVDTPGADAGTPAEVLETGVNACHAEVNTNLIAVHIVLEVEPLGVGTHCRGHQGHN